MGFLLGIGRESRIRKTVSVSYETVHHSVLSLDQLSSPSDPERNIQSLRNLDRSYVLTAGPFSGEEHAEPRQAPKGLATVLRELTGAGGNSLAIR